MPAVYLVLAVFVMTFFQNSALAQNVKVEYYASQRFYTVQSLIDTAFVYSDREFVFSNPPSCFVSRPYLLTPNSDKFTRGDKLVVLSSDSLMLTYVGYDTRYKTKPPWLRNNFTPTGRTLDVVLLRGNRYVFTFELWRSNKESRSISLGGNLGPNEKANNGMYTAFFVPFSPRQPHCPF